MSWPPCGENCDGYVRGSILLEVRVQEACGDAF